MPGTWGSVLALFFVPLGANSLWVILPLLPLGWWCTDLYEKRTKKHDASEIVIDEILGIFISFYGLTPGWVQLGVGFVLFRFFDILKPFPIGWLDKNLPGAWGTLLDDLAAGLFTCIILHLTVNWGWL